MRNKRGQIFSGILVLVTLAMCAPSIGIYMQQQKNVQSSLVSPLAVLEVRDGLDIFEMREKALIRKSLDEVEVEFGSEEFLEEFRDGFILGIDEDMEKFIFSNLVYEGKSEGFDRDSFLENVLYKESLSSIDSSEMRFVRGVVGKEMELNPKESDVRFPMRFSFEFDREYLISERNGKYDVEVIN